MQEQSPNNEYEITKDFFGGLTAEEIRALLAVRQVLSVCI